MRVLDNLENYDIPSGFHLTAEQEEQLVADLKEIVLALIPLRSSKLKTRQYFNSHLRYTSNVKYAQSRPDAPQDRYEFGDSYTPLPGEYTWNSDLYAGSMAPADGPDACRTFVCVQAASFEGVDEDVCGFRCFHNGGSK